MDGERMGPRTKDRAAGMAAQLVAAVAAAAIAIGCAAVIIRTAVRAPLGWEDADGFHYGEPPSQLLERDARR